MKTLLRHGSKNYHRFVAHNSDFKAKSHSEYFLKLPSEQEKCQKAQPLGRLAPFMLLRR
jgi:hypothetical protein